METYLPYTRYIRLTRSRTERATETRTPSAVARSRGVRPSGEASSHVRSQRLGGAGGGGPVPPGDGTWRRIERTSE